MRRLILGTAGHIDHGKTALVRALTGVDTDRLPEEKRRGITIDLGFASLDLPGGLQFAVVDVPGHEAFVRTMLAGASGIDLVLLVIAADEGVMPQTREHLAIIDLLGIGRGVIALTKSDLVEDAWLDLVRDDVHDLLASTSLADAPIVPVSARTGAGMADLLTALSDVGALLTPRDTDDLFRMPIDRVFTIRGTGTVVTGTVWSGSLAAGATVRIEPAGITARVRGLQNHGEMVDAVGAGARAAVALTGIDRHALSRGDTLISDPDWTPSRILTVELTVLEDAPAPVRARQRVRVHLGTGEVLARVAPAETLVEPGASAVVQLRLEAPLLARARDHVVIRSYSPVHTTAGARVLEPNAPKRKRLDPVLVAALRGVTTERPLAALLQTAAAAGDGAAGVALRSLPVLTGLPPRHVQRLLEVSADHARVGDRLVPADRLQQYSSAVIAQLTAFHEQEPLEDGKDREALRRMVGMPPSDLFEAVLHGLAGAGTLAVHDGAWALAGHQPAPAPADLPLVDRLAAIFAAAALEPPDLQDLPPELAGAPRLHSWLRHLERNGTLLRITPVRWLDTRAALDAASRLRTQLPPGQPLGIAQFRDVLGLTRKHLIPLLEHLDRTGITRRIGEERVLVAEE